MAKIAGEYRMKKRTKKTRKSGPRVVIEMSETEYDTVNPYAMFRGCCLPSGRCMDLCDHGHRKASIAKMCSDKILRKMCEACANWLAENPE